jgi:hypothetical protein
MSWKLGVCLTIVAAIATAAVWQRTPRCLHRATFQDGTTLAIYWVASPISEILDSRGHLAFRLADGPLVSLGYRFAGRYDAYRFTQRNDPGNPHVLYMTEMGHGLEWDFDSSKGYIGGNG